MNVGASNFESLDLAQLDFNKAGGLIAAIVQHARTQEVLMLGYMNSDALRETLARRRVVFYSRTRERLWEKGETSGNTLDVVSVRADCDRDTLLIQALPRGPVCHTGTATCFGDATDSAVPEAPAAHDAGTLNFLVHLEGVIAQRAAEAASSSAVESPSYTARLLKSGTKRVAQKVGEEGVETALAAVGGPDSEVLSESADLIFHLLVLLRSRGLTLSQVVRELERRHPQGGSPATRK